jgi:ubiquinone/menaquinone biosynthesis C-methylase UbiE
VSTVNDSKSLSQQRFGQFAEGYVQSADHAQGTDLDRLVAIAQPQPDWRVLDVATGGGHTALKFAPHVAHVTASDLTPRMLEKAAEFIRQQGAQNVDFREADAENLPFGDAAFDLVTCRIAPHHFPDTQRFVDESARVLKPGGLLLVQDHVLSEDEASAQYTDAFEKLRDPSHHRAYTESQWRAMFEQAGLRVTHTEQLIKRHIFLDWAGRQGTSPELITELEALLRDAPPGAADWLMADMLGTDEATFVNHHLIIAGRKQ